MPDRGRLARAARALLGLAGMSFMALAFVETWDDARGALFPGWAALGAALALSMGGLTLAGMTWSVLLDRPFGRRMLAGFMVAQLGKYVPGAVWQAVGQIGHAMRSNIATGRATVTFVVFALTQIATGGVLGAGFAFVAPDASMLVRLGSVGGLALLVLLHRRMLVGVVGWFSRRRGVEGGDLVPPQASIRSALARNLVAVGLVGLAFGVILARVSNAGLLEAATAFAIAWTAGLLVVPVPAGLGVREAVLIATLGHVATTSSLIAASVFLRLVFLLAEALVILICNVPPPRGGPEDVSKNGSSRRPAKGHAREERQ